MNRSQYTTSKKPILKTVLVILALALISGAAYGSWKVLGSKKEQSKSPETMPVSVGEEPTESVVPKPSGQPESEPTADWQLYFNSRVGYSVKYPKDFEFSRREEEFGKEAITLTRPANSWKGLSIFIEVETYPSDVSAQEWADWYFPLKGSSGYSDIVIDDMQGIKIDLSSPRSTIGEVILTKGNKVVRVRYVTEEVQKRDKVIELVNQILNSIKLD